MLQQDCREHAPGSVSPDRASGSDGADFPFLRIFYKGCPRGPDTAGAGTAQYSALHGQNCQHDIQILSLETFANHFAAVPYLSVATLSFMPLE
jgi:hypothetical protein